MLEDTIWDVRDIPTREVTAEDLDAQYLDIYNAMYVTKVLQQEEALLQRMLTFSKDLCMYLRGGGISPKTVVILIGCVPSGVLLHLEFSNRLYIMVRVFTEQQEFLDSLVCNKAIRVLVQDVAIAVAYTLVESDKYGSTFGSGTIAIGAEQLTPKLDRYLGWFGCKSCHYADGDVEHCGQGLEMYIPDCGKRLERVRSIWDT